MYTYVHPGTVVSDKIYGITLLSFSMLLLRVPLITWVTFVPDYAIRRRKGSRKKHYPCEEVNFAFYGPRERDREKN